MKYENQIRDIIKSTLSLTEPIESIDIDFGLENIGMDSLGFVKLIVAVEDNFNIEFPDEKLIFKYSNTIKNICEIIETEKSQ